MATIGFVSWKGGTGKTLLAFNTAERATTAGIKTVLCDFDPQPTSLRQCQLRATHSPNAPQLNAMKGSLSGDGIAALQKMARTGDQELLVCDMPGADSFTMDHALGILDLILIPNNGRALRNHDHGESGTSGRTKWLEHGPGAQQLAVHQDPPPAAAHHANWNGHPDSARKFDTSCYPLGRYPGRLGSLRVRP